MPGDPRLRVSDAERERTAELLREHCAVGRLTQEEFGSRLESVFAARTRGELDQLLADLPAIDLYRLPAADIRPVRRGGSGLERRADDALAGPALGDLGRRERGADRRLAHRRRAHRRRRLGPLVRAGGDSVGGRSWRVSGRASPDYVGYPGPVVTE